jgi:hypothetical protein
MYKIIKIDTNNVELWELKETKTASDKSTFEVWEKVKSYGIDVIEEETKEIDKQIEELNPTKMQEKITNLQSRKDILNKIKKEL